MDNLNLLQIDIYSRIPYRPKFWCPRTATIVDTEDLWPVSVEYGPSSNEVYISEVHCKPILFSLSDIIRPITFSGRKFIPIKDLVEFDGHVNVEEATIKGDIEGYSISDKNYKFLVSTPPVEFFLTLDYQQIHVHVDNVLGMYDYLNCIMADYRGLIDEGLAISVNALGFNPYKE